MTRQAAATAIFALLIATSADARLVLEKRVAREGAPPVRVLVYLPDGYDRDPSTRFPVLHLLHGLGGAAEDWRTHGAIEATLDKAIASGAIRPLIAVMPDGQNGYWSDWPDGVAQHRFAHLVDPIVTRWADTEYRTTGARVIAGVSMGGYGALSVALRSPERYVAALSFSGALFQQPPTSKAVYWAAFGAPGTRQFRFPFRNPLDLARLGQADRLPIWLDCGADDLPKFRDGLTAMSKVLRNRGVDHEHHFRPGSHEWGVWRTALREALPWVERQLAARDGKVP